MNCQEKKSLESKKIEHMTIKQEIWEQPEIIEWTQLLLNSYEKLLGDRLISRQENSEEQAKLLFLAPFVVVSHDTKSDPILNYGNQTSLELWQMNWQDFTKTPSRLTAEKIEQQERQKMIFIAARDGFIANYRGIRKTSSGKRFLIERATIWNVVDPRGVLRGQAATFSRWSFLKPSPGKNPIIKK